MVPWKILQVAAHAGRGVEVVVVVDMAIGAGARRNGVQASERESGAVVVERSIGAMNWCRDTGCRSAGSSP